MLEPLQDADDPGEELQDADDPGEELHNLHNPLDPGHEYHKERRRRMRLLKLRRRSLRDMADPFNVTTEAFIRSYRLTQDLVFSLIDLIRPFIRQTTSPLAVPLERKVLAVLSFYATGSYQTPTGQRFDCPIAQPTLCAFIEEVSNAIYEDEVLYRLIKFPSNVREAELCIDRNRRLGGKIDGTVGYTDGSLFKVKKPSLEDNIQAFIGRKNYCCINAQITCDRRLYIMNVLASYPGSTTDSFIFEDCELRRRMAGLNERRPCHLLGDSGYVIEPWMIIPFRQPEEDTPEFRFNQAHCSDRNAVERCIGVLKERFRFLNDGRVPLYEYTKVSKFVYVGVVLHNLCVLADVPLPLDLNNINLANNEFNEAGPEEFEEDDIENPEVPIGGRNARDLILRGHAVRQEIMNELEHRHQQQHR
ncbi:Putative nuclease [Frankliniella fusca]|uniref:Nuclease n=1 Tax=Frankliniella fusca TaxID=407009 RepID=A0AAE1H8N2_9NEOP|nr:Putative nuclease [Frankliniella fusca]